MPFDYSKLVGGDTTKEKDYKGGLSNVQKFFNTFSLGGNGLSKYNKSLYVYACSSIIAENVSFGQYELTKVISADGDTEKVNQHEVLDLIARPNPFETKMEFWEKASINLSLAGDAFILKVRDDSGAVQELYNMRPDHMTVIAGSESMVKRYEFTTDSGIKKFKPEDIIHIKYPSPLSKLVGTSPVEAARRRIEAEEMATEYQTEFFKNNARPDFILQTEGSVNKEKKEEMREAWKEKNQGAKNAASLAILEGGLKYQQISLSPREMDFIESMKHTREDIIVAFRVPKPMIVALGDSNRASAEAAKEIFLENKIYPELRRFAEKLNHDLVVPEFGEEFEIKAIDPTPENEEKKVEIESKEIENGTLTINEARIEKGRAPVEGGWSIWKPVNEQAVGGVPAENRKSMPKENNNPNLHGKKRTRKKLELKLELKQTLKPIIQQHLIAGAKKKSKQKIAENKAGETEIKDGENVIRFVGDQYKWGEAVIKKMDAQADSFADDIDRAMKAQRDRVLEALESKKSFSTKGLADEIFDKKRENKVISDFSLPFIQNFVEEAGIEAVNTTDPAINFAVTEDVQEYIEGRAQFFAESVNNTTLEGLEKTLAEGISEGEGSAKLADRVRETYKKFPEWRNDLIARTETTNANNYGLVEGYKQSGSVNGKEWLAVLDDRTRDTHSAMDGEIVALNDTFSNGLEYPSQPNCRCVANGVFKENI